ncbi:Carm1-pending protein [Aphelenchoides fujianensis]|nr:Carm1-pending protein [Aphelenchoides fujianensis]
MDKTSGQEAVRVELAPLKFDDVELCSFVEEDEQEMAGAEDDGLRLIVKQRMALSLTPDNEFIYLSDLNGGTNLWFALNKYACTFLNRRHCVLSSTTERPSSVCLRFQSPKAAADFEKAVSLCQLMRPAGKKAAVKETPNVFDSRTEDNSAELYFQFYAVLSQQQNMLQDFDRVVLDCGAGTGILSFFAIQAGAKLVYSVEASSMAVHCQELVRSNNLSDRIIVIPGKVEEIEVPQKVDVIISEPMGYMLVNERMLESYVHSRKFLKPGGRMFPTTSNLYFALFNDELTYQELIQKSTFWFNESFFGVNLSALRSQAFSEVFKQPCIITRSCLMHGFASWFDVTFIGSQASFVLSTAPTEPLTHWYQVRCFLTEPILVHAGDVATGYVNMTANERLSYDIDLRINVNGVERTNRLDLKNPNFRYMSGMAAQPIYEASFGSVLPQTQPPNGHEGPPGESNGVLSSAMSFENLQADVHVSVD